MFFQVDDRSRRRARSPHELAMVNLLVFNLLIGIVLLASSMAQPDSLIATYKWLAIALPLVMSLVVIAFTFLRAVRGKDSLPWFVAAHWSLAASHYRLMLIAYLICGAVLSLDMLGGGRGAAEFEEQVSHLPPAMREMERRKLESQDMGEAVWARLGVVPLLLAIMVTVMLVSGALSQAGRGEVPDGLVERFPPPADVIGTESELPVGNKPG